MFKKSLFLIGGGGFIGKNLVRCLSDNYEITVYDKYIDYDYFNNLGLTIKTKEIDLTREKIPYYVKTPNFIINLASIVSAERDMSLFDELISTNLKILLNLYERFKNEDTLELFIQFGSSEEYGSENSPFVESQREVPTSPYALVKQLSVNTAMMLYRDFSFPAMAVRPGNVFGPLQTKSKFIPYVIDKLIKNEPLKVTPCEQKRDTLYIDDFCWCIAELLKHPDQCRGEIVNVSSGESIELKKIIELAKEYLHSTSEVLYGALPYRENEVMDLCCSLDKLSSIIGKSVRFNIEKRLKEYINIINGSNK